jgi:hypothetical protein
MKTKILLLVLSLVFSASLFAEFVPLEKAKTTALNFYFEKYNQHEGKVDFTEIKITNTFVKQQAENTFYYVFSMNLGGFIIVPADDCLLPVLGYSFKHDFVSENQPDNVKWWFQQLEDQVTFVRENNLNPTKEITDRWKHYEMYNNEKLSFVNRDEGIGPLLTTNWNQGWPYNYYCPEDPPGSGHYTYAGCVATAIAQIFYYCRWPDHGQGYTSYIPSTHPEYGMQSADFENTWYRYDEMVDQPNTINKAIAEYIYHIAVSLQMNFTLTGSGPDSSILLPEEDSCAYFFKYTPTEYLYRDSIADDEEWKSILFDRLDNGFPIYYGGNPAPGAVGHAFVCDGYQDEEYFHFNLGWGGSNNGYYTIDDIVGYNYDQMILLGTEPDTAQFNYPLYESGADTCISLEGSITDGSGPLFDYLNNTQASWLIDPQTEEDSVTNISLEIKRLDLYADADRLYIYDGADNTALLIGEFGGNEIPEVLTSSGNQLFVEFVTDNENTAGGFYLVYHATQPDFCNGTTTITDESAVISDGSLNFNYYNSAICQWYLMPETDQPLTLNFNYFDTEEGHDFVEIYDMETQELLVKLSGNYETPPDPVTAESGQMLVAFISNKSISQGGWEAWYDLATAAVENNNKPLLTIMPNPVRGNVIITTQNNTSEIVNISLYNTTGPRLRNWEFASQPNTQQEFTLDLSNLSPGIYFLRLQAGNDVVTKKVVKL